jgi:hypothetical protein
MQPQPEPSPGRARPAPAMHPLAVELGAAMAQLMVHNGAAVTREHLLDIGFDAAELAAHGENARAYAARLMADHTPPYEAWWPLPKHGAPETRRARMRDRRLRARATGDAV